MAEHYLTYPLRNNYIHNWIVAGPQAIRVDDLDRFQGDDFKLQIVRHYHQSASEIDQPPAEWATFNLGEDEFRWRYTRCLDDHFVDRSTFHHICHYLRCWAYAEVVAPSEQTITLVLTSNGPADIWLNDQHVHRQEHIHHQQPQSGSATVTLQPGPNTILVRFEAVATRECPFVMALELRGFNSDEAAPVRIPTSLENYERRRALEEVFEEAYLKRDTFSYDDSPAIHWPDDLTKIGSYTLRIQTPTGKIYAEVQDASKKGAVRTAGKAYSLPDGDYWARLLPLPVEYYEKNVRIERIFTFHALRNKYSAAPYGAYAERRQEAIRDAATRRGGLYSEIAKMAGRWWKDVKAAVILEAIDGINDRRDCSDFYLTGLLGMLYRFGDHANFPETVKQPLEDCVLNFKYWADEPGSDSMWYWSENHQILFHTCEILAGQRYPDRVFSNSGQNGSWHREKGERLALAWLRKRARYGFQEWDSNCYFEHDLVALSHLLDLAENQEVWELAAVVMDKLFLTIALNSFKGVFGSTHGRSYTKHIKSGYGENTAGLTRLMWGQGIFNTAIMGTVSMACCENYQLPQIIADIATDLPTEPMWHRERHAGDFDEYADNHSGSWEVNKVTYKTADYMLCSAQDYRPGQKGYQEHIWQATMDRDAVVFVTHPPCVSEEGAHRPGFWHGNFVLPRVAQWKDTLLAIHQLPPDDWLGFTHAYFPTYAFDEYLIRDGWAFARKGDGYLALTASQGIELVTTGQNASRDLRSHGRENVWLCQMGRQAEDDSFTDFQERVLQAELTIAGLSVHYAGLRGESIDFAWEGPLLVNNEEQPLNGFKHYDGPHAAADWPATILAAGYGHNLMRLDMTMEPA